MNSDDSSYHTSEAAGSMPADETYPHSVIGLHWGRKCGEGRLCQRRGASRKPGKMTLCLDRKDTLDAIVIRDAVDGFAGAA